MTLAAFAWLATGTTAFADSDSAVAGSPVVSEAKAAFLDARQRLADAGIPLTLQEAQDAEPVVPDEENVALIIREAGAALDEEAAAWDGGEAVGASAV